MITIEGILPKVSKCRGVEQVWRLGRDEVHNADIELGKSIRIYGKYNGKDYDKTYKIGDYAEWGSYNITYYGKISQISAKSVTIEERNGGCAHRLDLYKFSWRNYNFDVDAVNKQNSEWYD